MPIAEWGLLLEKHFWDACAVCALIWQLLYVITITTIQRLAVGIEASIFSALETQT